jgi:hypothetical protein
VCLRGDRASCPIRYQKAGCRARLRHRCAQRGCCPRHDDLHDKLATPAFRNHPVNARGTSRHTAMWRRCRQRRAGASRLRTYSKFSYWNSTVLQFGYSICLAKQIVDDDRNDIWQPGSAADCRARSRFRNVAQAQTEELRHKSVNALFNQFPHATSIAANRRIPGM